MQTNLNPTDLSENSSPENANPECSVSHCSFPPNSTKPGALCDSHYQKAYRGLDPEDYTIRDTGRADVTCAFDDCLLRPKRVGLCTKHHRAVMTAKLPAPEGIHVDLSEKCAFETCENHATSYKPGALCQTHYVQKNRGIELMDTEKWGAYKRGEVDCLVDSCTNKAQTRELCRNHYSMIANYKITVAELVQLRGVPECQNAGCKSTYRLCIDHDHATGLVRSILCGACNTALGYAKEDAARLRGLADYIEAHSS